MFRAFGSPARILFAAGTAEDRAQILQDALRKTLAIPSSRKNTKKNHRRHASR